jgi:hypothetical protein
MVEVQIDCPVCESSFYEDPTWSCSGVLDVYCHECGSDLSVDYHVEAYTDSVRIVKEGREHLDEDDEE